MLTLLKSGHARNDSTEDVNDFDDEEHMNHVGESVSQVNETCLSGDHRTFLVSPNDKDSQDPILIHITPADMTHTDRRTYVPAELKQARKERRKEKQKDNKRSHMSHLIMEEMKDIMVSTQHHRHHGDQHTDERILLRKQDNTKRFFCTVFN